ncbi:c-type cytochrome [Polynucleobacter brandtiae]|nr:c-type cytochrome [Polynucleobacter brandtiae]
MMLAFSSATLAISGEETYKNQCFSCHAQGLNNAPKLGDVKRWSSLIKEGQEHITADGYHGVKAMPPKGGNPNLSLADFANAVVYMANQSGGRWEEPNADMLKNIAMRISKKK